MYVKRSEDINEERTYPYSWCSGFIGGVHSQVLLVGDTRVEWVQRVSGFEID